MDHVAFAVADRRALELWATRLTELGVTHSGIKEATCGGVITLRDPDSIQLSCTRLRHRRSVFAWAGPDAGEVQRREQLTEEAGSQRSERELRQDLLGRPPSWIGRAGRGGNQHRFGQTRTIAPLMVEWQRPPTSGALIW